jgi:hypothetical protein
MRPWHAKITTKLVTGLKHEASQYEVTDTGLPDSDLMIGLPYDDDNQTGGNG